MIKKIYLLLLLSIILTSQGFSQAKKPMSRIAVKDNRFVKADGSTIYLKGLNASDPEKLQRDNQWNAGYFAAVKSWGSNVIRFPVHPSAWRKLGKNQYLKLLDEGVELARVQGLYVIIDWHSIGNLCTERFTNASYNTSKQETLDFWKTIAARYKKNTTVAFLELFNEPTTNAGKLGECSWKEWKVLVEEMITVIRKTGSKAVPLVAGFNWAYDLKEIENNPVNAKGIGYVSHPYPMKREKPWEPKWTADWGFAAKRYPLILTEIGFCGADEPGAHIPVISDESYGDAITAYCEENGISYLVWVFDTRWAPMLISDWNFTPTRQGRYFKNAIQQAKK